MSKKSETLTTAAATTGCFELSLPAILGRLQSRLFVTCHGNAAESSTAKSKILASNRDYEPEEKKCFRVNNRSRADPELQASPGSKPPAPRLTKNSFEERSAQAKPTFMIKQPRRGIMQKSLSIGTIDSFPAYAPFRLYIIPLRDASHRTTINTATVGVSMTAKSSNEAVIGTTGGSGKFGGLVKPASFTPHLYVFLVQIR